MKDLKKHRHWGVCESCLYGDQGIEEYPCNKCKVDSPTFTEWDVSHTWEGHMSRGEEYTRTKEGEDKMPKRMPTSEQSVHLSNAIEHFNHELFNGVLDTSKIMAVFTRNPHVIGGYFSPDKWEDDDGEPVHEVALNSNTMLNLTPIEVYGILIHELLHAWQWDYGKPTRNGYHNKEWCLYAEELGLECYTPEGERTLSSQNVATKIAKDGLVEAAIAELPEEAWLPYTARPERDTPPSGGGGGGGKKDDERAPKKAGRRAKYTCSFCGINIWGKSGLMIQCLQSDCSGNTVLIEQV